MALNVNGTAISNVTLNGNQLDKVTLNGTTTIWQNWVLVTDNPINASDSRDGITGGANTYFDYYKTFSSNIRPIQVYLATGSSGGTTFVGACKVTLYLLNADTNEYEQVAYRSSNGTGTVDISTLTEGKVYSGLWAHWGGVSSDGSHSQYAVTNITQYYARN